MKTTYKIETEIHQPDTRDKKIWVTHDCSPFFYHSRPECINDLKAYRMLTRYKDRAFRAIEITETIID